jgi:hypothetical protein
MNWVLPINSGALESTKLLLEPCHFRLQERKISLLFSKDAPQIYTVLLIKIIAR